jgi:hypothetical protein
MGSTIETYKALDTQAGGIPVPSRVIDLQTVWSRVPIARLGLSLTDGSPACPAGFAADHTDLNFGAGGAYAYLCVERATAASNGAFVTDVAAVVDGPCPPGFTSAGGNVKEGTAAAAAVALCFRVAATADARVATAISVAQGRRGAQPRCPAGHVGASGDLSQGLGERSVLCVRYEKRTAEVVARASRPAATSRLPAPGEWSYSTRLAADKSDIAALGKGALEVRVSAV